MPRASVPAKKALPKWLAAAKLANGPPGDWLARALGRAGVMRSDAAEAAIRGRRISVDGKIVTEPLTPLRSGARVCVDGRAVEMGRVTRALMFHKPAGCVVAGTDRENAGTVFQHLDRWLPQGLTHYAWHGVGRLDRNTTGLFLFTNDEKLLQHLTLPASHLPKTYLAKVAGRVSSQKLEPLRVGISLEDGPCRPARAQMMSEREVSLTITEGRNHQVKRMLAAVGLPVLVLHRSQVGDLQLDLPEGHFRELQASEISKKLGFIPLSERGPVLAWVF